MRIISGGEDKWDRVGIQERCPNRKCYIMYTTSYCVASDVQAEHIDAENARCTRPSEKHIYGVGITRDKSA